MIRRLQLVRHTAPAVASGVCYGRLDLPLAASADDDIATTLAQLDHEVGRLYSSPAQRCQRLAAAISQRAGVPVRTDARLLELDFGRWEGQPWNDIARPELDAWSAQLFDVAPGGGETLRQLWQRIGDFIDTELRTVDGPVTIVSHHGPLRVLYAQWHGRPPSALWDITLPYGGIVTVTTPAA